MVTNLLLVTTGLGLGGAEVVVRDLAVGIDRGRFNVTVCCMRALGLIGEELARDGVDIFVLDPGELQQTNRQDGSRNRLTAGDYLTFLKLRRVIREKRIEVLHSHTTYALTDGCLAKLTTAGLRLVHTFHFGNYPHKDRRALLMEGLASRVADRLIAVGDVQREQIRSVYRLQDGRIRTVRNGVRQSSSSGDPGFRARIGCEDGVMVGTLANLIEQKGLHDLLAVASRFRASPRRVRFVVIGEGPLRPELEKRRRELGLDDVVLFPGFLRNAADVALPVVDIYFQPSRWEAMSIAILEAMGAGKPVVATDVGEARHVIDSGRDGFLVAPRDVEAMASAISGLIDDPGLGRTMGQAAAERVSTRFSIDGMVRAYEAIYLDVLGRRGLD